MPQAWANHRHLAVGFGTRGTTRGDAVGMAPTVGGHGGDDGRLVDRAAALLVHRVENASARIGSVAAALQDVTGRIHVGLSIIVPCGMGFCAEHAAAAAMVATGVTHVLRTVAVNTGDDGAVQVIPPCGRCREFLRQLDARNVDTVVLLDAGRTTTIEALLPDAWRPRATQTDPLF